jgi:hypothetical protein
MCSAKKTLICAAWVDTDPCQPNVYVVSLAVYTSLLTVFPNTLKQLTTTSNSSGAERFSFSNLVRIFSGYHYSVSSPTLPTSHEQQPEQTYTTNYNIGVYMCVGVHTLQHNIHHKQLLHTQQTCVHEQQPEQTYTTNKNICVYMCVGVHTLQHNIHDKHVWFVKTYKRYTPCRTSRPGESSSGT